MGELHHHLSIISDGSPLATTVSSTLLHNHLWEDLNFFYMRVQVDMVA
jgi:hypothetical protein